MRKRYLQENCHRDSQREWDINLDIVSPKGRPITAKMRENIQYLDSIFLAPQSMRGGFVVSGSELYRRPHFSLAWRGARPLLAPGVGGRDMVGPCL